MGYRSIIWFGLVDMYVSVKDLMEILSCSDSTVRRIIREMSKEYPPETFLVRLKRVKLEAVLEYCGKEKL